MDEFIKIPKDRVAVLIGTGGQTKREIEKKVDIRLKITKDGSVSIHSEDHLKIWLTRDIVRAIARGFSPKNAFRLLNEENTLLVIDLESAIDGGEKALSRVKGRIIGEDGKSRRVIEELTNSKISVYGKTVSVIAKEEDIYKVENAILLLAKGQRHSSVYRFLEQTKSTISS